MERRLELGEFLGRRVAPNVVVLLQSLEFDDEIVVEALIVCGGRLAMALVSELILLFTRDLPLLCHPLAALAHRQARSRLDDHRKAGFKMARPQAQPWFDLFTERFAARASQQQLPIRIRIDDRYVARGIHTACDAGIDLADRDLEADRDRGIEARAARALQVESRRVRIQAAVEHRFAYEIEVARMLEHGAAADVAEPFAAQAEALDERFERRGEHLLIAGLRICAHRTCEGDSHSTDDRDSTYTGSYEHGIS